MERDLGSVCCLSTENAAAEHRATPKRARRYRRALSQPALPSHHGDKRWEAARQCTSREPPSLMRTPCLSRIPHPPGVSWCPRGVQSTETGWCTNSSQDSGHICNFKSGGALSCTARSERRARKQARPPRTEEPRAKNFPWHSAPRASSPLPVAHPRCVYTFPSLLEKAVKFAMSSLHSLGALQSTCNVVSTATAANPANQRADPSALAAT